MARASRTTSHGFNGWLPAALVGIFLATLTLTVLREQLIEVGYEVVTAVEEETRLREERDQWIARVQALRNPARLTALADEIGLARPDHTIDLRILHDGTAGADLIAENRLPRGAFR